MNWRTKKINKTANINITVLIILVIICGLCFYLFCEFLKFGFRMEEIRERQRFETYEMLEVELKEQRRYKMAMFRELDAISWCESRHDNKADNPDSTALGCFQILDGTRDLCEKHLDKTINRINKEDSWDCAIWLYKRYGLKPWDASKSCWNKLIQN